jgi:carbonic anhydrase
VKLPVNSSNRNSFISRRQFLTLGVGAVGTAVLTTQLHEQLAPKPALAKTPQTPDEALERLMAGNRRFVTQRSQNPHQSVIRLEEVAEEQYPFATILGCADSRVTPEIIFDQGLGDLFVIREAGNVVTPEEMGSIEYGTKIAGSKVLMVLGHERCGAVTAALKGGSFPGQIGSLVAAIQPAIPESSSEAKDALEKAVKANVAYQIGKLKTSPVLLELVKTGQLKIVGGYYDLDTGAVTLL